MGKSDKNIPVSRDSIELLRLRVEIEGMLMENGIIFQCDKEGGMITCYVESYGMLSMLKYSLLLLSFSRVFIRATIPYRLDINDKHMRKRIMKFVTYANYGLVKGAFEISKEEISFRDYVETQGEMLDKRLIQQSAEFIMYECARYFPGITRVLFEGARPKDEVERCQKEKPYPFGLKNNADKSLVVKHFDDIPMIAPSEEEINSCLPFVT